MKIKNIINRTSLILATIVIIATPTFAQSSLYEWSDEQVMAVFNEVARNFGAVEYATYTFMVEFARPPESLDELRETGHLNVFMTNPITGGEVMSLDLEDFPDGVLEGNIWVSCRGNGVEAHIEAWFLRKDDSNEIYVRSMVKRLFIYQSEIDYNILFENNLPREEQIVAIYCMHAVDALESFVQRNGRNPDDFDDLYENGDVNVHYINPITGELAVSSEELSAGDFFYEVLEDDKFVLIGWGRERPVFFATTDETVEQEFYEQWPELALDFEEY